MGLQHTEFCLLNGTHERGAIKQLTSREWIQSSDVPHRSFSGLESKLLVAESQCTSRPCTIRCSLQWRYDDRASLSASFKATQQGANRYFCHEFVLLTKSALYQLRANWQGLYAGLYRRAYQSSSSETRYARMYTYVLCQECVALCTVGVPLPLPRLASTNISSSQTRFSIRRSRSWFRSRIRNPFHKYRISCRKNFSFKFFSTNFFLSCLQHQVY